MRAVGTADVNGSDNGSDDGAIAECLREAGTVDRLVDLVRDSDGDGDGDGNGGCSAAVRGRCALCLVALLPARGVQEAMDAHSGSYDALFGALARAGDDEGAAVELVGGLVAMLATPGVGDVCAAHGLLDALAALATRPSVVVQSLAQKAVVALLKTVAQRALLRHARLVAALQQVAAESPNASVRSSATKLASILSAL